MKKEQLSIFGKIDQTKINSFTPPYSLRNDCQIGQWKTGSDNLIGNSLEICPIKIQHYYGNLGKTKKAQWLQLWFVGAPNEKKLPKNTVCVTYLKSRSMNALGQKFIEVMNENDPGHQIFTGSFEKHVGDLGNYYSVQFEARAREGKEEQDQLELIGDFLSSEPKLVDTTLPPAMVLMSLDDLTNPLAIAEANELIKQIQQEQQQPALKQA